MVKSNVRAMPKIRKPRIPPELLERLEELERQAREDSRETERVIAEVEKLQRRLREIYVGR